MPVAVLLTSDEAAWVTGDTAATTPLAHYIKDWAWDDLTAADGDRLATEGHHTGRTVTVTKDNWSDVLLVSGTEASREHNGYMEGALDAAQVAVGSWQLAVGRLHQIENRNG